MRLSPTRFQQWNRDLAFAIRRVGQADFPAALGKALQSMASFTMINAFGYRGAAAPIDLYNQPPPHLATVIVDAYLSGAYQLDPFFAAVQSGGDGLFLSMQAIAPDRFTHSEYFNKHYRQAELLDEVGYVLRLKDGLIGVLSLTRKTGQPRFNRADLTALEAVAPLVCCLGEQHWNSLLGSTLPAADTPAPALHRLGGPDAALTPREAEIVRLILRGHSTESIGLHLSISQETVKVHRKNLYKKLKISTQAELFALFIGG